MTSPATLAALALVAIVAIAVAMTAARKKPTLAEARNAPIQGGVDSMVVPADDVDRSLAPLVPVAAPTVTTEQFKDDGFRPIDKHEAKRAATARPKVENDRMFGNKPLTRNIGLNEMSFARPTIMRPLQEASHTFLDTDARYTSYRES